jgi:cytochrome c-type biogenesis protein CcmH/NrfG
MATPSGKLPSPSTTGLPAQHTYLVAGTCLMLGLLVGYFLLSAPARSVKPLQIPANRLTPGTGLVGTHPKLTLDQMKQMADVQASTLLEKSKTDPNNPALLVQIAGVYQSTHQFKEAADSFQRALQIDPRNVSARTELASCLYYAGDPDGALSQLQQALKYKPTDANSLFNLGMIIYRGKHDPKGAIAAWQELLKVHPDLDRKPIVEKMIAEAQGSLKEKK